jgi:hypothetical protein
MSALGRKLPLSGPSASGQNWSFLRHRSTHRGTGHVSARNGGTKGGALSRSYRIDEVHDAHTEDRRCTGKRNSR